jgi:7-cyano-7-deazaguanine reductase
LVNKLIDDLVKACHPRWMRVEVIMNPRGGIGTTVSAEYPLFLSLGGRGKRRGKQ